MKRFRSFRAEKNIIKGYTYEYVARKKGSSKNEIVEVFYGENGFEFPDGYDFICLTDNSVMNVLAVERPDDFFPTLFDDIYNDDYPESKQEWCEEKNKDIIIEIRAKHIAENIAERVEAKETNQCIFDIRINGFKGNIYGDPAIKEITDILDRNGVEWQCVDTVSGAWNLNHDWIETSVMECAIEYSGVYPVNWKDANDIALLEYMVNMGYIYINVMVYDEKGKLHPNS